MLAWSLWAQIGFCSRLKDGSSQGRGGQEGGDDGQGSAEDRGEEHVAQEEAVREQLVSRATFADWPPYSLILLLVSLRQEVWIALL